MNLNEFRSKIIKNFQGSIYNLFIYMKKKYGNLFPEYVLVRNSFLIMFYLFLLNFNTNKSFKQVIKKSDKLEFLVSRENIKLNLKWNDFKEYIKIILSITTNKLESNNNCINNDIYFELDSLFKIIEIDQKLFFDLKHNIIILNDFITNDGNLIDIILTFGQIYENFLKKFRAEYGIQNDKKYLGIYYTPRNLAKYVIKTAYTELLKRYKIKGTDDLVNLKILDPSMGTGNFLIELVEYIINVNYEFNILLNKSEFKLKIIENSIYGVDIDPVAVEIARWGLFLYANTDKEIFQKLKSKLKLGNSLMNIFSSKLTEIYPVVKHFNNDNHRMKDILTSYIVSCFEKRTLKNWLDIIKNKDYNELENLSKKINSDFLYKKIFLWEFEFPEVFNNLNSPGFDLIVGNPPHIENKKINLEDKKFLKLKLKNYTTTLKLYDYTLPFIELSLNLLKNNGVFGLITINKFLSADYGHNLRKLLLEKTELLYLIDISNLNVFPGILSYPIILIIRKNEFENKNKNKVKIGIVNNCIIQDEIENNLKFYQISQITFTKFPKNIFPISSEIEKVISILKKKNIDFLKNLCDISYRVFKFTNWGIYLNSVYNHKNSDIENLKFIGCGNIEKYGINWDKKIRLLRSNYKKAYLYKPKDILQKKWLLLKEPKILIREVALNLTAAYDENGEYGYLTGLYMLYNFKISPYYLLGVLNSRILDEYYKILFGSAHLQKNYLNFHSSYLKVLPIVLIPNVDEKVSYNKKIINNLLEFPINQKKLETELNILFKNNDLKILYSLTIIFTEKIHNLVKEKYNLTNIFYALIEKLINDKIENLKKSKIILEFYKYNWDKIEEIITLNKKNIKDENNFNLQLQKICEKFLKIKEEYNNLIENYNILKRYLDKIVEKIYI